MQYRRRPRRQPWYNLMYLVFLIVLIFGLIGKLIYLYDHLP